MNIVKRIDQYNDNFIYFCEPIKNNIMNDGQFIRILYSTHYFTLNGVYLLVTLNEAICEKYYNKYKCIFNVDLNKDLINDLKVIEETILKKCDIYDKTPQYKIYEQVKNGHLKLFNEVNKNNCTLILKISGVWETINNYGLTYKFIKVQN
jgi:hypothetical protein